MEAVIDSMKFVCLLGLKISELVLCAGNLLTMTTLKLGTKIIDEFNEMLNNS